MNDKGLTGLWSLVVRYRDKCQCQICGRSYTPDDMKQLHAHHIYPRSQGKGLYWDSENGVSLCFFCHYRTETNKSWFWDMIIPRLPHERFESLSAKIAEAKMHPSRKMGRTGPEKALKKELDRYKEDYADYCDSCQIQTNHTWRPA